MAGRVKQSAWGAAKSRCFKGGKSRVIGRLLCLRCGCSAFPSTRPPPVPPILTLSVANFVNFYIFHFTQMIFLFHVLILWKRRSSTRWATAAFLQENSGPTFPPTAPPSSCFHPFTCRNLQGIEALWTSRRRVSPGCWQTEPNTGMVPVNLT